MATAYDNWLEGNCGVDDAEEARAERIEELLAEYAEDDAKLREAEEWIAGSFDGSHYTALSLALFGLHKTSPDKLIGSGVLQKLYELAKVEHAAMRARLVEMAEEQVSADEESAEIARGEAIADARELACWGEA